jgi:succinate dehydrogenase / fumarate reductase flavoprotein subunit
MRSGSITTLLSIRGSEIHPSPSSGLGQIMWDYCGMERTAEGRGEATAGRRSAGGVLAQRP